MLFSKIILLFRSQFYWMFSSFYKEEGQIIIKNLPPEKCKMGSPDVMITSQHPGGGKETR